MGGRKLKITLHTYGHQFERRKSVQKELNSPVPNFKGKLLIKIGSTKK